MDNSSSQQKTSARRHSLKLHLPRQKSVDSEQHSLTRRKSFQDQNDTLRRVQSFNSSGKFHRRSKVLHKARSKMMMIKITLSSPDSSPEKTPPEIFSHVDFDVEGAKKKSCTPRNFSQEKSYKVYFDNLWNKGKHVDADIIIKEREQVVERVPVNELIIQKEKHLQCNNMNLVASPPEWNFPDLRTFGNKDFSLCERELHFLQIRKLFIRTAIQKLLKEEITHVNDVPQIALMGSGGGYRAMVAMSGIVNAMYDEKLLDCIMYTAALSGSSWYTATLYSDPGWPNVSPRDVQEKMKHDISSNPKNISNVLHYGFDFFTKKWRGEDWNFTTDVFGPMLGDVLIPDRLESRWSDQAVKLTEGTLPLPLPLLAAIHAKKEENTDTFHEWVEFTPFEVSISKYGAAINMKHFGSEFKKGVLTKEIEEPPLYQIMGICGSAFTITHQELLNKDAGQSKHDQPKSKHLETKINQSSSMQNKHLKNSHPTSIQQNNNEGYDELDGIFMLNEQPERKADIGSCNDLDGISRIASEKTQMTRAGQFDQLDGMLNVTKLKTVHENEKQFDQLDGMPHVASQNTVNRNEELFDELDGMRNMESQNTVDRNEEKFDQLDRVSCIASQKAAGTNEEQLDQLDGMSCMTSQKTVSENEEQFDQLDGMSYMTSQKAASVNEEQFDQLDGMSCMQLQKTMIAGNGEQFDQLDRICNVASPKTVNGNDEKFDQLNGMSSLMSQQEALIKKTNDKDVHAEFDILDCVPENMNCNPGSDVCDVASIDNLQSSINTEENVSKQTNNESEPNEDIMNDLENSFATICKITGRDLHHCENITDESESISTNSCDIGKSNIKNSCSFEEVFDEVDGKGENNTLIINAKQMQDEGIDVLDGFGFLIPDAVKEGARKLLMKDRSTRAAMVNNFLRKVSFDEPDGFFPTTEENSLFENYMKMDLEKLCIIDAGIAFNSPYPLLFQPGRDIDLILSFDFTDRHEDANDPFQTLLKTEKWARTHEIKFPKIAGTVDKFKGIDVQELYIFEDETDEDCPIIMHFVLVNNDFRKFIKPGIKRISDDDLEFANFNIYDDQSTFNCMNFQYSEENFNRLSKLSEFIVLNNMEKIKTCISKSIENKRKRSTRSRQRHPTAPL